MAKREPEGQVTLKIPRPLYEQLKQVITGSGFHSVTEFAVYVLRDLVSHHGRGTDPTGLLRASEEGEVQPLREPSSARVYPPVISHLPVLNCRCAPQFKHER